MTDVVTENMMSISAGLFTKKRPWDQLCQDIAEHFYPVRANFTQTNVLGSDFAMGIMDSHTINVREELSNAVDSMLRQGDWFTVGTGDEDRDKESANSRALERATQIMWAILHDPRANFAPATKEADHDWVAFGNPVLSVEENNARDFLRVRAWHPGTCAWLDDDDGQTNVVHRKFTMQARIVKRMVETGRWEGPLDRDIEMMCRDNPGKEINFLHIVMPSDEVYGSDGKKMRDLRHPFVSCYIDVDHRQKMHESGEPLMPYMAPRWRRLSGFNFGFSPAAMNSLPDARMLQDMARVILEQGEKAVDPPIIGAGEVFTRDMNLYAGGFTYVDMPAGAKLGDLMTTVETSEGLRTGVELKQDVRALITEAFLLNKLYLPGAREMRELEVAVRTEEFRRAALPFFTPIESEYHTPLLGKVFDRAVLMGLIPREMFPEELTDEEVRFTFHSPLNEAEGKAMVESFNIMMQTVAASAQVDETVANIINIREATRDAVRGGGAKATWLLSEKEMKKKDVEAEQVQQLRQGAQIAREGAGVVSDVSNAAMAAEQAGLLPQ